MNINIMKLNGNFIVVINDTFNCSCSNIKMQELFKLNKVTYSIFHGFHIFIVTDQTLMYHVSEIVNENAFEDENLYLMFNNRKSCLKPGTL